MQSTVSEYETFREIMEELLEPINGTNLDSDTLKRLYESKLVYLENLRIKCFYALNSLQPTLFSTQDYQHILNAIYCTKQHLKEYVIQTLSLVLKQL